MINNKVIMISSFSKSTVIIMIAMTVTKFILIILNSQSALVHYHFNYK